MADDSRDRDDAAIDEEIARYREAVHETLDQLDWCIKYLYRIRKPQIASAIEKNRTTIRRQISAAG